ncbi:MAG: SRPBCC family protein, partial [Solirubrobacterales bacterium]
MSEPVVNSDGDFRPITVTAITRVDFRAETVYSLLSDLRRHWPLLGSELEQAQLVDGSDGDSAELIVRMPGTPLTRAVVTRVLARDPGRRLSGQARAGRTIAEIEWAIEPIRGADRCTVTFAALIRPGSRIDAILA